MQTPPPQKPQEAEEARTPEAEVPGPPAKNKEGAQKTDKVFRDILRDGSQGPEMIVVPAGIFRMGDLDGSGDEDEKPMHRITFAKPFAVTRYEVTFDDYEIFTDATGHRVLDDRGWGRGDRPVIDVSWGDAVVYASWLSEQTAKRYRLPTEAEWEYSTRAGTETAYWWGNEVGKNRANCNDCGSEWDGEQTAPVGSFAPNAWGLYDTVGNVGEWVQDCWHESYQHAPADGSAWLEANGGDCRQPVIRGGSWGSKPGNLRSAYRFRFYPDARLGDLGFRLARTWINPLSFFLLPFVQRA